MGRPGINSNASTASSITVLDACSGLGSAKLSLELSGFVAMFSESDFSQFKLQVLSKTADRNCPRFFDKIKHKF